jgi:hypothetical protein
MDFADLILPANCMSFEPGLRKIVENREPYIAKSGMLRR